MSPSDSQREAQAALADAVKRMAALLEEDPSLRAVEESDGVTQTDVAIVASALLRVAEIEIFELALWQAWGTPSAPPPVVERTNRVAHE
jgi:hypothetical protein